MNTELFDIKIRAVEGGVTAAAGFKAAGIHAGFRKNPERLDYALVVPDKPCPGAGVFTTNRFCAAPVQVSRANLGGADKGYGIIAGVSVNSGNANAATGETGLACARETCSIASQVIGCEPQQILVASTGVIGQILPIDTFETAIPAAYEALSAHGGGKAINEALSHYDIPVEFKNGQRVTTPATMDIVREVLGGKVNQELVAALNHHGNLAVGVSGSDAGTLIAEPLDPELGRVGKVTHVNTDYIERLLDSEYIPVIATVAAGEDGGFFNINADTAAGAVAAALHAHKAIFLTDVDGLYKDFSDKDSLISNLTLDEVNEMLYGGEVDKGMIPKLRAAVDALAGGVFRAHIINGTTPHSLLLELLTDAGVGTVIHSTEMAYEFDTHPHPLSTFAARLTENLDEVEKLQTV